MSKAQREAFVAGSVYELAFSEGCIPLTERIEAEALHRYPDSPAKCVRDIVVEWLKDNGYDGLCNKRCWCTDKIRGLGIAPLMEDCIHMSCRPGVLVDGKIVERVEEYRGTLNDAAADALDY